MRGILLLLITVFSTASVTASTPHTLSDTAGANSISHPPTVLSKRDGDVHMPGYDATPLTTLNETEILLHHAPTPPSYWSIDIEGPPSEPRHPGLMAAHVLFMCLAFFVSLPAGIALRSARHALHAVAVASFWVFVALGTASAAVYRKLTPDMYEHQVHSSHGWLVIFVAAVLSTIDGLALLCRLGTYVRGIRAGEQRFSFGSLWMVAATGTRAKYARLALPDEPEDAEECPLKAGERDAAVDETDIAAEWVNGRRPHSASDYTLDSEEEDSETVREHAIPTERRLHRNASLSARIGTGTFATVERLLVFAAFAQVAEGVVIYTGGCRENYLNGCLAHIIKGGIFWCYGLVSFARYLGAFSALGWAWNRPPRGARYPSAEFVESLVCFLYGASNTWMERFGAHAGDPFTTKQLQHIGIAVMFWFAGLVGMGLESRRLRALLAGRADPRAPSAFNPFPALVIGVTGAAMAAHHQTYRFQMDVHAGWGRLLVGFAAMRCLTYAFMWVRPVTVQPTRPPTEALGSFFLACGGLTLIASTEEVTFAAMRRGRDDVMMFLNVTVALTCLVFCWVLLVVGFKAWIQSRTHRTSFRPAA